MRRNFLFFSCNILPLLSDFRKGKLQPSVIFLSDLKSYQQYTDNIYLNSQIQKSLETNEINDLVLHLATMAQSSRSLNNDEESSKNVQLEIFQTRMEKIAFLAKTRI
ncbi:hypothetical protein BpHYR1_017793 [Brachionus plicatilis]|uniref:Uncharacterized protein n=1 Tax=Brachionus plicatilis TaxID=10195 RepID=A0A3M7QUX8_BRAPC|nr:hypothetical protein BpHYR1_017793 [Brachionus plicatilis]